MIICGTKTCGCSEELDIVNVTHILIPCLATQILAFYIQKLFYPSRNNVTSLLYEPSCQSHIYSVIYFFHKTYESTHDDPDDSSHFKEWLYL